VGAPLAPIACRHQTPTSPAGWLSSPTVDADIKLPSLTHHICGLGDAMQAHVCVMPFEQEANKERRPGEREWRPCCFAGLCESLNLRGRMQARFAINLITSPPARAG
jgi:hypothetical protein